MDDNLIIFVMLSTNSPERKRILHQMAVNKNARKSLAEQ